MTEHHKGAVAMARTEIEKGEFRPAKDLAVQIISDQEKEIAEMTELLRTVGA